MAWLWVITIALVVCSIVALFMVVGSAMRDPRDPGAGAGFDLFDGDAGGGD